MFMSEYAHTIDAKGRIILPADFRAELGEHFVITKGLDKCLFIYDENEWAIFSQKLKSLPLSNPKARDFVRFFFSGAKRLECDKQGRFLVPGNLRSYAVLEKDVVLIGVSNRIEVWSKAEWSRCNEAINSTVASEPETLADLGI